VVEARDVFTGEKAFSLGGEESNERGDILSGARSEMALSADGALLASVYGKSVTIWDMERRNLLLKLPREQGMVRSLAWSPNRELLAVATSDGGLAIWNLPKIKAQLDEIGLGW
jgi:WD40 repeat protein